MVSIYIVYEPGASSSFRDDPTLKQSLFDTVKLTKNANIGNFNSWKRSNTRIR